MSSPLLLPRAPASVTNARRSLCADLEAAGVDDAAVSDALLVLSELLSNALRHAAPLPDPFPPDSVRVTWTVREGDRVPGAAGSIEIAVCDGGGSSLPRIARPSISALGGRGLGIVERVADRWGTEVDDRITTVWAVLPVQAESSAEPDGAAAGTSDSAPARSEDREHWARAANRRARGRQVSPNYGFLIAGS
ncbi:anti-sigma regulatory factor (Ser/Thr protein kinase) [Lipingzhangella halophila]|uniref:Anti-sigma regulatory factor (Ser/Thr protein kinase) n=1 Tax=Lipingzhangella halophila TaxID=1783352 RepID=A0A7W7W725_9ACTN|nr:ATP-binding protein [Lipingzhangella halophila]MBB4935564.1 anti-sigma regulatory factor (Ser/Thr protein kinase) [Lipingzhangella halophila]